MDVIDELISEGERIRPLLEQGMGCDGRAISNVEMLAYFCAQRYGEAGELRQWELSLVDWLFEPRDEITSLNEQEYQRWQDERRKVMLRP